MKRKNTTYLWAENGSINNLNQSAQEIGYIPNTQANADDVNFGINYQDQFTNDTNNELFNLLDEAGIVPDDNDDTQVVQSIKVVSGSSLSKKEVNNLNRFSGTIMDWNGSVKSDDNTKDLTSNVNIQADITKNSDGTSRTVSNNTTYYLFIYDDASVIKGFFDTDENGLNLPVGVTAKVLVAPIMTTSIGEIPNFRKIVTIGTSWVKFYNSTYIIEDVRTSTGTTTVSLTIPTLTNGQILTSLSSSVTTTSAGIITQIFKDSTNNEISRIGIDTSTGDAFNTPADFNHDESTIDHQLSIGNGASTSTLRQKTYTYIRGN